jgi:hypothetical protein
VSNGIQNFNLTEHIREKVRETLVMSIPDEQMDTMIRAEFDDFFKGKPDGYGKVKQSRLGIIVQEELDKLMREKIRRWLDTNFQRQWDDGIERHVGELVGSLAPIVQQSMMADIVQRSLSELRYKLGG